MEMFIKRELTVEFQKRISLNSFPRISTVHLKTCWSQQFTFIVFSSLQANSHWVIQIQVPTSLLGQIYHNLLLIVDWSKIEKVTVKLS